jgi:two-component system, LytTR family, sensor kinase
MPQQSDTLKVYWLCQLLGWGGMVAIEVTNYTFFIVRVFDWSFVFLFSYGAIVGILLTHLFKIVIRRTPVFTKSNTYIWSVALISSFIISLLQNLFNLVPYYILSGGILYEAFEPISFFAGIINWMRYVGVWIIIYFLYKLLDRKREIEEGKLKSENLARTTELELLKTQLNPHFLFNSLNSIKALVTIDPEKSKDAIVKLSELLRFTLNYSMQELIPFNDELQEVKKYLALEQIRFGERLSISYKVDDTVLNRLIPPTMLLSMAENAIKHGIAKQSGLGILTIESSLLNNSHLIKMTNTGVLVNNGSNGIGLRNIRKRLESLYGNGAELSLRQEADNVVVTIKIDKDEN